jgi:hypothetical protein
VPNAEKRVDELVAGFTRAISALGTVLSAPTELEPHPVGQAALKRMRQVMLPLAGFAQPGAIPRTGFSETGRATLYAEAWALADGARRRLDELTALKKSWDTTDAAGTAPSDKVRLERASERLALILGRSFPLLPRFTAANAAEVSRPFARSDALLEGDSARALGWLQQVAKARAPAALLDDALALGELLVDETRAKPLVGQLPVTDGEACIARNAPSDPTEGRLGLFAVDHGGLDALKAGAPLSGLVVDSWTERIAASEQVTGLAVHFDAPSSRAPQAMLLVVPPEGEKWSFDLVADSLMETLELAKLRAVDPDILLAHGHQMPAIFASGAMDAGPQPEAD